MKKVIGIHETGQRVRKSDSTTYDRVDLFIVTDEIPSEYTGKFQGLYVYQYYIEKEKVKLTGVQAWNELIDKEIEFKCTYGFNKNDNALKIKEIFVVNKNNSLT